MERENQKFNLIDEHWIPVETIDGEYTDVSLRESILNAHNIRRIRSETSPLDATILRNLTGLIHKLISEKNESGKPSLIKDPNEALDRIENLWDLGHFPPAMFSEYFEEHYNDFWLISDGKRFGQTVIAKNGTGYSVAKMIPTCSESSNKVRLFNLRNIEGKKVITLEEAARYIFFVNGYDDTSSKPSQKGLPSAGCGWLGKIGQVYAEGENLFQTLLLNTVLIKSDSTLWPEDQLSWEKPENYWVERRETPKPADFGSYMTWRSRHLWLDEENGEVKTYKLVSGDFFDKANCEEPFTIWTRVKPDKKTEGGFTPRKHSAVRQIWREFNYFISDSDSSDYKEPMIVGWISMLIEEGVIPESSTIRFITPSVSYGDKDFFIDDITTQEISLAPGLLREKSKDLQELVRSEIENIDKMAAAIGYFFKDLAAIHRFSDDAQKKQADIGREKLYRLINSSFRQWLSTVGRGNADPATLRNEWQRIAFKTGARLLREEMDQLIDQADPNELLGVEVKMKTGKGEVKTRRLSIFDGRSKCLGTLKRIYPFWKTTNREENYGD